jgi:hypothetical protein
MLQYSSSAKAVMLATTNLVKVVTLVSTDLAKVVTLVSTDLAKVVTPVSTNLVKVVMLVTTNLAKVVMLVTTNLVKVVTPAITDPVKVARLATTNPVTVDEVVKLLPINQGRTVMRLTATTYWKLPRLIPKKMSNLYLVKVELVRSLGSSNMLLPQEGKQYGQQSFSWTRGCFSFVLIRAGSIRQKHGGCGMRDVEKEEACYTL